MVSVFDCVSEFLIQLVKEDPKAFRAIYAGECKSTVLNSTPTLEYLADGYLAKMEGNYDEAIRLLETYIDTTGTNQDNFGGAVAECYRLKKDYKRAIEYCNESLKAQPYEGTILLELAHIYHATGNDKKALEIIDKIKTKVWYASDERFMSYRKLLDLEELIKSS